MFGHVSSLPYQRVLFSEVLPATLLPKLCIALQLILEPTNLFVLFGSPLLKIKIKNREIQVHLLNSLCGFIDIFVVSNSTNPINPIQCQKVIHLLAFFITLKQTQIQDHEIFYLQTNIAQRLRMKFELYHPRTKACFIFHLSVSSLQLHSIHFSSAVFIKNRDILERYIYVFRPPIGYRLETINHFFLSRKVDLFAFSI